jgi:NAD(P) transhydrogenase subunit alpha
MYIGIPRESAANETRVAATPETVKKYVSFGLGVRVEKSAGIGAFFSDEDYKDAGAEIVNQSQAMSADIVLKVNRPNSDEAAKFKTGSVLVTQMQACTPDDLINTLAEAGVATFALERVPRISRAQNVDVLSSQSNIGGYRAALKSAELYGSFLPMMMTSAGSARPASVLVLGAGVAGLQAIATARKLGARVQGYDVRPEVKEQVESLGAGFLELKMDEDGSGEGGYAKQLDKDAQARQQQLLSQEIVNMDIVISTAAIPCRKAPVLIPEETVKLMRPGSVIIDMAASSGGNCPLTRVDQTIVEHGVTICGITNYPALMPSDASAFFSRNLLNFVKLLLEKEDGNLRLKNFHEDEITSASLTTNSGEVCFA